MNANIRIHPRIRHFFSMSDVSVKGSTHAQEAIETSESDSDTSESQEKELLRLRDQVKELTENLEEERRLRAEEERDAKETMSRLVSENEDLRAQLATLSSDLNEADQQLQELVDGDEALEEHVALKKELYAIQKENTSLQSRIDALEEQLEETEKEAAELRSTVSMQARDLLIQSQEYKSALRELEQNRNDLASLMKEQALLKSSSQPRELGRSQKLDGLRRENASLQGMVRELRLQLLKLGRHEPVPGDAPDLESEGLQLEIQSEEDAKHAFQLASATVSRIAESFVASGSDAVLREVGRLLLVQRQLAELGESLFLPLAEDQLLCVKRNNDQLIGRLNESNAAMQVMQERMRDVERMLTAAREQAAILRERHPERELNRVMEAAAQEQERLERELETARDALRKDEVRILKLETDSLGLHEEIERGERMLREREEAHAKTTRELKDEVVAKERSLKLTREDLEEAEEDVEDLEKEVAELKKKVEEVTEVRDKLREDVRELTEDNDELVRELKDLNGRLKGLL